MARTVAQRPRRFRKSGHRVGQPGGHVVGPAAKHHGIGPACRDDYGCARRGEGSSGIRWLDDILLQRVLAKLVHGGLVVTDGAGMTGAAKQAALWTAGDMIDPVGTSFDAFGRHFVCGSVFCPMERPTLVWHVS